MAIRKDKISDDIGDYSLCILGESGIGKEQPISEPVLTPDGFIPMGDVKLGSYLIGLDGKPTRVTGVFPQGLKPVYKITFSDGSSTRCGLDHNWTVYDSKDYEAGSMVKTLRELMTDYLDEDGDTRYFLPDIEPVQFTDFNLSEEQCDSHFYDPYANGRVYALSCVGDKADKVFRHDDDIYDFIVRGLVEDRYRFLSGFIEELNEFDLVGSGSGMIGFLVEKEKQANAIANITRSLGLYTYISQVEECDETDITGVTGWYSVMIQVPKSEFEKLTFDENTSAVANTGSFGEEYRYVRFIEKIEEMEPELCQCVLVDNPDHIYLTKDYIPTHNTTIMVDTCEICFGPEGYILLDIGKEDGVCSLADVTYEHIETFKDFEKLAKDIIKNKETNYPDLKVLVIDTLDELIEISMKRTIDDYNASMQGKDNFTPVKTFNAAWGSFDGPHNYLINMIWDKIWALKKVGVTCWYTGHVKTRSVIDPLTGASYDVLTTDTMQKEFNAFKKKIQLTGIACMDRTLEKVDTGRKDLKNKKIELTRVADESRRIVFRDDNHSVDAKSRLKYIIDAIPMDADSLIDAMEGAIDKYNETTVNLKDERARKREERMARRKAKQGNQVSETSNSELTEAHSEAHNRAESSIRDSKAHSSGITLDDVTEAYKACGDKSKKSSVTSIVKEYGKFSNVPEERWEELYEILNG